MPRNYLSGSSKRKKKVLHEQRNQMLSAAMKNFVIREEEEVANVHADVINETDTVAPENKKRKVSEEEVKTNGEESIFVNGKICNSEAAGSTSENARSSSCSVQSKTAYIPSPDDSSSESDKDLVDVNSHSPSISCGIHIENDFSDPALWPPVTESLREYFVHNKVNQNINLLENSKKVFGKVERTCSKKNFIRLKKNGEVVKRDWLVYSPSTQAVFCYICKLFGSSDQALCQEGYSDWRNISKRLSSHENSTFHRKSIYSFSQRSVAVNRVDCNLVNQHKAECEYWKKILYRVVAVVKFISIRGLACFGDNETLGSLHNGNFLGIIELLSSFDSFLADHIKSSGNKGRGSVNYLSSTIVTEFISIMSNRVLQEILSEVKEAKYFGLIVDSTSDICHVDQLAIVLRYVDKDGEPTERFLKFIAIHGHGSQHLQDVILDFLENLHIELKYCRGQSFDNASNMSGKYSGLQARLKSKFPLIDYVPCVAHSLNLVGTSAAECCHQAVSFFGLVQSLYNFFSASTHRWELLTLSIVQIGSSTLTLKSLSGTRWSANADAVKALKKNYCNILNILSQISNSCNETPSTRHEANSLYLKLKTFESALMTVIWDSILQRMNSVSKTVQSVNCEMAAIVPLYSSLAKFIDNVRNNFSEYEKEAEVLVNTREYTISRAKKTPKSKMLDESVSNEVTFSEREHFLYQVHYVICDSIITELEKRKSAYALLESRFGFMCIKNMPEQTIKECAKVFQGTYSEDIEEEFPDEFLQFNNFVSDTLKPVDKLKMIKSLGIGHTFPNVETALRIMLSIPITNCSSERSFSALKRIKNRLRSCLSQNKLSGLALLAIESDITNRLQFDDIIEDFANYKARKRPI